MPHKFYMKRLIFNPKPNFKVLPCLSSGFCHVLNDVSALPVCYAALTGS